MPGACQSRDLLRAAARANPRLQHQISSCPFRDGCLFYSSGTVEPRTPLILRSKILQSAGGCTAAGAGAEPFSLYISRSFCGFFPVDLETIMCYTHVRSWKPHAGSDSGASFRPLSARHFF